MPSQHLSSPSDQTNELDSLLSSVLLSSDVPLPTVRSGEGNPLHYGHASGHASALHTHKDSLPTVLHRMEQRKSDLTSQRNLNFRDLPSKDRLGTSQSGSRVHHAPISMESHVHPGVEGTAIPKQHRSAHRVHYSDSVLHLGHQPRTSPSKVSSNDHMQTSLPGGIGGSSSNDYKYVDRHSSHPMTSPNRELNHQPRLSSTRNSDVIKSGRGLTKEVELVDDVSDVLLLGDLEDSPLNLSDEFVGGVSFGELEDDGELSDVSELLLLTPNCRPKPKYTSVSAVHTLILCEA